jgi:hypothetical protein
MHISDAMIILQFRQWNILHTTPGVPFKKNHDSVLRVVLFKMGPTNEVEFDIKVG